MASKHLKAKKQRLLSVLEAKRYQISERADHIQSSMGASAQKKTDDPFGKMKVVNKKKGKVASSLNSIKDLVSKTQKGSQALRKIQNSIPKLKKPTNLKPIIIGASALVVIGAIAGQGKRKHRKKELETLKDFRPSIGLMLFKWLLSAFQPAAKHLISQQVKKRIG